MAPESAQAGPVGVDRETTDPARERAGHRERLIDAMAASIQQRGYRETTVADVVRLARTSRRNFYEHFDDRDACFLALFDATNDAMMEQIAAAVAPEQSLVTVSLGPVGPNSGSRFRRREHSPHREVDRYPACSR